MIDLNDFRYETDKDFHDFVEKIPERLTSLSQTLTEWDGEVYDFSKTDGLYPESMLEYDLIRKIETWALEISKETESFPNEYVLELCSLLGEIVMSRSKGNWELSVCEVFFKGERERLIPSIAGWGELSSDLPFSPLLTLEHFLRTKEESYLELAVRYYTEVGEAQFQAHLDLYTSPQNSRDKATDFLDDELEFFSELLEEHDIDLNTERDPFGVLENRSFYSEEVRSQIETFFQENAQGIDEIDPDDMADMMSAYVAQYCCDFLNGYADFDRRKLVVIWSETESKEGKLVISEILEKIENQGAGTIADVLSKCVVYSGK